MKPAPDNWRLSRVGPSCAPPDQESGGEYLSRHHQWLLLSDATMKDNGQVVLEKGRLPLA